MMHLADLELTFDCEQIKNMRPTFANKNQLYKKVDTLLGGMSWKCREITQKGNLLDAEEKEQTETLEVWYRDPVECV